MQTSGDKTLLLDRHVRDHARAYESGVLVPEEHHRLVADIDFYADKAGVTPEDIWTHAKATLNDRERAWIRQVIHHGQSYGYALVGRAGPKATHQDKCRAMAAACVRNFTNARYLTADELFERLSSGDRDPWRVQFVAVPDFLPPTGGVPEYRRATVSGWLMSRLTARLYTCVGIGSKPVFKSTFGVEVTEFVKDRFESTESAS